jgi:hypothetical protein
VKRIPLFALVVSLLAASALADLDGAWTAQVEQEKDRIFFNTTRHPFGNWGMTHDLADFVALTRAQIDSPATTPVQFQLRREAGTIAFEGTFRRGFGAGQFTFTPNRNWLASIRSLGVKVEIPPWLREMRDAGVETGSAGEAKKLAALGVTAKFVRDLAAAGYTNLSVRDLTRLAAVGVDGKFIRDMQRYKEK